jgi:hypothetical protein
MDAADPQQNEGAEVSPITNEEIHEELQAIEVNLEVTLRRVRELLERQANSPALPIT